MPPEEDHAAAWSAAGAAIMFVFVGLATLAWQAGEGLTSAGGSNDVAQPAFGVFVAGAIISVYFMVAPLLHLPPYRRSTPRPHNSTLAEHKAAREETPSIASRSREQPRPTTARAPKQFPPRRESVSTAELQQALTDGVRIRNRLNPVAVSATAMLTGNTIATESDVREWEERVERLLLPEPMLLAEFQLAVPPLYELVTSSTFLGGELRRRMKWRLKKLEDIIRGVRQ